MASGNVNTNDRNDGKQKRKAAKPEVKRRETEREGRQNGSEETGNRNGRQPNLT